MAPEDRDVMMSSDDDADTAAAIAASLQPEPDGREVEIVVPDGVPDGVLPGAEFEVEVPPKEADCVDSQADTVCPTNDPGAAGFAECSAVSTVGL